MLKAKRLMSTVLAVLMTISMMTCIVIPHAHAETDTIDRAAAYADLNANTTVLTVTDGKITVDGNPIDVPAAYQDKTIRLAGNKVMAYDPDWTADDLGITDAVGTYFFAQYGDGTTWGNGDVYLLKWRVNAFGATQYTDVYNLDGETVEAAAGTYDGWSDLTNALRHIKPVIGADNSQYVLLFPGLMKYDTAPDGASAAITYTVADVTTEKAAVSEFEKADYTNVYFCGPQAGVSPSAGEVGNSTLCNDRSVDTEKEIVFANLFRLPLDAVYHVDGVAMGGKEGQDKTKIYMPKYKSAERVSGLYMSNLYFDVAHTNYMWCHLGTSSKDNTVATVFHLTDSYFKGTATLVSGSVNYQAANDWLFDNVVYADMDVTSGRIRFTPTKYSDTAFLGEYRKDAHFEVVNSTLDYKSHGGDGTKAYSMFSVYQCSFGDYEDADILMKNNYFGGYKEYFLESGENKTCNIALTAENNTFVAHEDAIADRFLYVRSSDYAAGAEWTFKNNTFISDPKDGNTSFDFYYAQKTFDASGNLYMDHDGNVRPVSAGYVEGKSSDTAIDVLSDIYVSDEFSGGVNELFTIQDTNQDLLVTNSDITTINTGTESVATDGLSGTVTVLPQSGVTYTTKDLFKYKDDGVKLLGFYSDADCKTVVDSFTKGFGTLYAKAQYKTEKTTATVIYTITEPTAYHVVAPNSETSYTFNGTTFTSENAAFHATLADAVTAAAPTDVVLLMPGTYSGTNSIEKSVAIVGPKAWVAASAGKDSTVDSTGAPEVANGRSDDATTEAVIAGQTRITTDSSPYVVMNGIAIKHNKAMLVLEGSAYNAKAYAHFNISDVYLNQYGNASWIYSKAHRTDTNDTKYTQYEMSIHADDCYFYNSYAMSSGAFNLVSDDVQFTDSTIYAPDMISSLIYVVCTSSDRLGWNPSVAKVAIDNCYIQNNVGQNSYLATYRTNYTNWSVADPMAGIKNGAVFSTTNSKIVSKSAAGTSYGRVMVDGDSAYTLIFNNNEVEYSATSTNDIFDVASSSAKALTKAEVRGNILWNANGGWKFHDEDKINVDDNFYGVAKDSDRIVVLDTASGVGYTKSSTYWLDATKTKKVDISKFDLKKGLFEEIEITNNVGSTADGKFTANLKATKGATYKVADAFKAAGGTVGTVEVASGTGTITSGVYTPVDGDVLTVPVTYSGYTIKWSVTVSTKSAWAEYGLDYADGETYIDLTTQENYEKREGGMGQDDEYTSYKSYFMAVAPDWTKWAYRNYDAATGTLSDPFTSVADATGSSTDAVLNIGDEFYAKMPTSGIVYKFKYAYTAGDITHTSAYVCHTLLLFPGEYDEKFVYDTDSADIKLAQNSYGAYYSDTIITKSTGKKNGITRNQIVVGLSNSNVRILGPQVGISAANVADGTIANSRVATNTNTEAYLKDSTDYIYVRNEIYDDGGSLIIDGISAGATWKIDTAAGNGSKWQNSANAGNIFTITLKNSIVNNPSAATFHLDAYDSTIGNYDDGADLKNTAYASGSLIIEDSYVEQGDVNNTNADSIDIIDSVIKTTDTMGMFRINPSRGDFNTAKVPVNYSMKGSYFEATKGFLYGVYFNGTTALEDSRTGLNVEIEDNYIYNLGTDPDVNNTRDNLFIAFAGNSKTDRGYTTLNNLVKKDFNLEFKNNIVENDTGTEPASDCSNLITLNHIKDTTIGNIDISGNTIIGYNAGGLFNGLDESRDVSENLYYAKDGTTVVSGKTDGGKITNVVLNPAFSAHIKDYEIIAGAALTNGFTWKNPGTDIYADVDGLSAVIEHTDGLTVEDIKANIKFASDEVSLGAVTDKDGNTATGAVAIGDIYKLTATHAETGKSITYNVIIDGLLPGATKLEDTAYAGRHYFDDALADAPEGVAVAYTININGVDTLVQFNVGKNVFGNLADIPMDADNTRNIYLFAKEYAVGSFSTAGLTSASMRDRNFNFYGAQAGVSAVVDTNNDGIPDGKNPARADLTKETIWLDMRASFGYQSNVTIDGVTLAGQFNLNEGSGRSGDSERLQLTSKLINCSTDDTRPLKIRDEAAIVSSIGNMPTCITVANNYLVMAADTDAGYIVGSNATSAKQMESIDFTNNYVRTPAQIGIMAVAGGYNISDSSYVNVTNNNLDSSIEIGHEIDSNAGGKVAVTVSNNLIDNNDKALDAFIKVSDASYTNVSSTVLKDNTIKNSGGKVNYAIVNGGAVTVNAADGNVFDGFTYNFGDVATGLTGIVAEAADGDAGVLLSDGDKHATMIIGGTEYAANTVSSTFTIANLLSSNAVIDTTALTAKDYIVDTSATHYIFKTGEGMMVRATIDGTVYYNAIPMTNGKATATIELIKINGDDADGVEYTLTLLPYCDHTSCYLGETPFDEKAANCGDGYAKYYCPINGDIIEIVLVGTGNHTWDAGVITTEPTCQDEGVKTVTCTVCGATTTEAVAVVDHKAADDAQWVVTLEETCKDPGLKVKYCQWCKTEVVASEVIPSTGQHKFVETVIKAPNCTETGETNYHCYGCNVSHNVETPMTGHNYKAETTKEPTCIDDGIMTYTCQNTGCKDSYTEPIKSNGKHMYESTVTVPATCHTVGEMTYTCGVCGDNYTEDIPATGAHNCTAVVTTEPTCTVDGEMTYTCQNNGCTYTYTEVIPNKGGHVWDPWTMVEESSCTVAGTDKRVCSVCHEEETRDRELMDHVWSDEFTVDIKPTGTVEGEMSRHCLVCIDARTDITNMGYCLHENAAGENWVVDIEPDCIEEGSKYQLCPDCGDVCNTTPIPRLPHVNEETGVQVPVTCTTDGVMGLKCINCGETTTEPILAQGHNPGIWKTTQAAQCNAPGIAEQRCTICDELLDSREIAATNHSCGYTWIVVVMPGCETVGVEEYTCKDCGYVAMGREIAAKGHQDVHVTTVPATCTEAGERTYVCTVCDAPLYEVLPATGHTAGQWEQTKIATTMAPGEKVQKCVDCDEIINVEVIEQVIADEFKFVDVPDKAWYNKAVYFMYNAGLMNGTGTNMFSPNASTTRGMFVTILGRLSGIDDSQYTNAYFEDVKDGKYYFGYVEWARVNGIVEGTGNYVFQPDRAITRQEMCKMIISYASYAEIELENKNVKVTFTDDAKISKWAKSYVYECQRAGIVSGDAAGTFRPKDTATRAEIAKLIMNFYVNYIK